MGDTALVLCVRQILLQGYGAIACAVVATIANLDTPNPNPEANPDQRVPVALYLEPVL